MLPRKRSRELAAAEEATRGCPLPADLLLEIVARSDAATLVRCAALCRSFRRDIRRPAFIRRVCHDGPGAAVPPCLLGFLHLDPSRVPMPPPSFTLAHPAMPAARSFAEAHLASLAPRSDDADRLAAGHHRTLTSRDGLVLLRRTRWTGTNQNIKRTMPSMCVYDPMTGKGTFFTGPPLDSGARHGYNSDKFVLLTAADGIGCPFLILAADFSKHRSTPRPVIVQTFSPAADDDAWSPATIATHSPPADKEPWDNATVVYGGFVHWIMYGTYSKDNYIFTYNVLTAASRSIELPAEVPRSYGKLHLASSSSGRRLSLLVTDKFKVTIWLLMSGDGGGASWVRSAMIDTERAVYALFEPLRSYVYWPDDVSIVSSGARSGAVLLRPYPHFRLIQHYEGPGEEFIVLDLETGEMHSVIKKNYTFLYEVDLASRLSATKSF